VSHFLRILAPCVHLILYVFDYEASLSDDFGDFWLVDEIHKVKEGILIVVIGT
jgi:hypothetical protein